MKGLFKVVLVVCAVGIMCVACGGSKEICPAYSMENDQQETVNKEKA